MWILTCWLVIMGAAGLCYPRRPRTAGTLFLVAGGFIFVMWSMGAIGDDPPIIAATSAMLGIGALWKFRVRDIRAAHVSDWTGKE